MDSERDGDPSLTVKDETESVLESISGRSSRLSTFNAAQSATAMSRTPSSSAERFYGSSSSERESSPHTSLKSLEVKRKILDGMKSVFNSPPKVSVSIVTEGQNLTVVKTARKSARHSSTSNESPGPSSLASDIGAASSGSLNSNPITLTIPHRLTRTPHKNRRLPKIRPEQSGPSKQDLSVERPPSGLAELIELNDLDGQDPKPSSNSAAFSGISECVQSESDVPEEVARKQGNELFCVDEKVLPIPKETGVIEQRSGRASSRKLGSIPQQVKRSPRLVKDTKESILQSAIARKEKASIAMSSPRARSTSASPVTSKRALVAALDLKAVDPNHSVLLSGIRVQQRPIPKRKRVCKGFKYSTQPKKKKPKKRLLTTIPKGIFEFSDENIMLNETASVSTDGVPSQEEDYAEIKLEGRDQDLHNIPAEGQVDEGADSYAKYASELHRELQSPDVRLHLSPSPELPTDQLPPNYEEQSEMEIESNSHGMTVDEALAIKESVEKPEPGVSTSRRNSTGSNTATSQFTFSLRKRNNKTGDVDSVASGSTSRSSTSELSQKRKQKSLNKLEAVHSHLPSPSPAECGNNPDSKPEGASVSNVVGSSRSTSCFCRSKPSLMATRESVGDTYCQAMDCFDGRVFGCCNEIDSYRLLRPSPRIAFSLLCNMHTDRLRRHQCCPTCGLYCTQGKFYQCRQDATGFLHYFHKKCAPVVNGESCCPHCLAPVPPLEIKIELETAKYPLFLPQQQPIRTQPTAKISFTVRKNNSANEDTKSSGDGPSFSLSSGQTLTSFGLSDQLDKQKLEQILLSIYLRNYDQQEEQKKFSRKLFYKSLHDGDTDKVIQMLGCGYDPNGRFREKNIFPLHLAVTNGHLLVVHILVQAGAQLDTLSKDHMSAVMLAVMSKHNHVLSYLVKSGASVLFKGEDGMTALHMASRSGNLAACQILLSVPKLPLDYINWLDDGGWTALVWAAEHRYKDLVEFLMKQKANPYIRDSEQNVCMHWAAYSGSLDICELLLAYGCDLNSSNVHGDTPVHIAARQDNYDCVILYLARGVRLDIPNVLGQLPLDCCPNKTCGSALAIDLNIQLRKLISPHKNKRIERLVSNDISKGKERLPIQCINSEDNEGVPNQYLYVIENCSTRQINIDRTITSLKACTCDGDCTTSPSCFCSGLSFRSWYDSNGILNPDFNFQDPPMLFECNPCCSCNRITCKNRVFQNGITVRLVLFRTKGKGWGVKTLLPILKGTYVCEYIGEIISDNEADQREDDSYLFDLDNKDGETYCIDAYQYGNISRFINHKCDPNLIPVKLFVSHQDLRFPRIAFFASRDIEAGEELGFDYGDKFWVVKCKLFTCNCLSEKCRYSTATIQTTLDKYKMKLNIAAAQEGSLQEFGTA